MAEDVGRSTAQVSVPLGEIASEQVLKKLLGEAVKVGGISDFALRGWE